MTVVESGTRCWPAYPRSVCGPTSLLSLPISVHHLINPYLRFYGLVARSEVCRSLPHTRAIAGRKGFRGILEADGGAARRGTGQVRLAVLSTVKLFVERRSPVFLLVFVFIGASVSVTLEWNI